jgi:gas vesicle protein GvpL/GvpF
VHRSDDPVERLRAAIEQVAADDAAELIAAARAEARQRVVATLTDAFADSMLERAREQLSPTRDRPAPERPPERRTVDELGWYVYGVVAEGIALATTLPGVEHSDQITTLSEGPLAAVASKVPLEEFGEARLREHLADMDWVEGVARAHESVLDDIREQTTVIPMRMCTVYRSEDGIRRMLRREAPALTDALEHLEGKTEWGVKVLADLEHARSLEVDADEDAGQVADGAAYMARKRSERDQQERAAQLIDGAAAQIHERLCEVAGDGLVLPPQRPEASGHRGEMVLNGVYLVHDDDGDAFRREVHELQAAFGSTGLELQITGPWPAYNFVPGTIGAAW